MDVALSSAAGAPGGGRGSLGCRVKSEPPESPDDDAPAPVLDSMTTPIPKQEPPGEGITAVGQVYRASSPEPRWGDVVKGEGPGATAEFIAVQPSAELIQDAPGTADPLALPPAPMPRSRRRTDQGSKKMRMRPLEKRRVGDDEPLKCAACGKEFLGTALLRKHLLIHSDKRPHECWMCDKKFYTNYKLQAHIRTHTGERPYECHLCQKKFTENNNLKTHLITHTTGTPYECPQCDQKFSTPRNLKNHLPTHTGETVCPSCDKKFSTTGNMKLHIKRVHAKEKPSEDDDWLPPEEEERPVASPTGSHKMDHSYHVDLAPARRDDTGPPALKSDF